MNTQRLYRSAILGPVVLLCLWLSSCSSDHEEIVSGSSWLSEERDGEMYDVIVYPITNSELAFFESHLARIEEAAQKYPKLWDTIANAEDPRVAATDSPLWDMAEVSGRDVIAVTLKLTFLREFGEEREVLESDMRENLAWLETRLAEAGKQDEELWQSANTIRALLGVVEANRAAGTFELYDRNRERMDAMLDRFTSIGEH